MRLTDRLGTSCVARDEARSVEGVLQGKLTNARAFKYVIDRRNERMASSYAAVTVDESDVSGVRRSADVLSTRETSSASKLNRGARLV